MTVLTGLRRPCSWVQDCPNTDTAEREDRLPCPSARQSPVWDGTPQQYLTQTAVRPPQGRAVCCTSGRTDSYEPHHNQFQVIHATAVYTAYRTPCAAHRSQDRFHGRPLLCFT